MREPGRPSGRRCRPSDRPSVRRPERGGGAERHARAEPGRAVRRPAAAADRPSAAAVDHPWGAFCRQVDPRRLSVFGHPVVNIGVWVPIFQQRGLVE